MQGITFQDYVREILGVRMGENPNVWSASDLAAIDAAAGYTFGRYFSEAPNAIDAIQEPLDSVCAGMFEDADGVIRFTRFIDPRLGTPTFDLTPAVVQRPISIKASNASYLTTRIGVRRNWSPHTDSDYVTDDVGVGIEERERLKRRSQFELSSTVTPSGHYSAAIDAPIFDSLLDERAHGQTEIDRVNQMFSPQVYPGGGVSTGKRLELKLIVLFDDIATFGVTMTTSVRNVLPGSVGLLTYPDRDFDRVPFFVLGTELWPFAGKMELEVFV